LTQVLPCDNEAAIGESRDLRPLLKTCGRRIDQKLAARRRTICMENLGAQISVEVVPYDHVSATSQSCDRWSNSCCAQKLISGFCAVWIEELGAEPAQSAAEGQVVPDYDKAAASQRRDIGISLVSFGDTVDEEFRPAPAAVRVENLRPHGPAVRIVA
jgi:hypothetical protein